MSIQALLNPVEEQLMAHQEFTDQDFVDLVTIEPPIEEQDRDDQGGDCAVPLPVE